MLISYSEILVFTTATIKTFNSEQESEQPATKSHHFSPSLPPQVYHRQAHNNGSFVANPSYLVMAL